MSKETNQVFTFPGGQLISNQADITLVNNTLLTTDITVPANMRWKLWCGESLNADNVGRRLEINIVEGAEIIHIVFDADIPAGNRQTYPNTTVAARMSAGLPIPMSAGQILRFVYSAGGASAGGTGKISAIVTQLRVGA